MNGNHYESKAYDELKRWRVKMSQKPSIFSDLTKGIQNKTNNLIPDQVHDVMTSSIKNMVRAVLTGSEYTTKKPLENKSLELREKLVYEKITMYKKTAAIEGAGTGAGGFLLGLADFPLLLSIKMKFLFEIASIYGIDVRNYHERLYILHLFQLAFSSDKKRIEIFNKISNWDQEIKKLSTDINDIDWRSFQQEYRDYIDLAKLLQMVPGVGAFVGAYANYRLLDKLGTTAMNGYRLRYFQ